MKTQWNGHTIELRGDWTLRWLYLAPEYELLVDGLRVARAGGPRTKPQLNAVLEDEQGTTHELSASLVSLVGWKPSYTLKIGDEVLSEGQLIVDNILNPILMLFIMISCVIMLYVGPTALAKLM